MSANKVVVTTVAQFTTAVQNAAGNDTTCIDIQLSTDILTLNSSLSIPGQFTGNASKRLTIEGNGITINCPPAGFGANVPLITRNTSAVDSSTSLVFRNITFDCGGNQMVALEILNASNVIIENCNFNNCYQGLVLKNVNTAAINNCIANNTRTHGFLCTTGPIQGNICNNIVFTNCKVVGPSAAVGACIGWGFDDTRIVELNNIQLYGGITSGVDYAISNTSIPSAIKVNNITLGTNVSSGVKLTMNTGFAVIDGVYINVPLSSTSWVVNAVSIPLLDGATLPHVYVRNVIPSNIPQIGTQPTKYRTQGGINPNSPCITTTPSDVVVWEFYEVDFGDSIFFATRWDGGFIPFFRYAEFFSESKTILTNSMTVNSKPL